MVENLDLSAPDKEKVGFYARQMSSALAPTNFPLSNPEVVRRVHESRGRNLIEGVEKLIEDQKRSGDFLNVCMSDNSVFSLGDNIANTPGKVIFENELMQLIQYNATQEESHEIPLLFTPSWVNKFYIYDLREHNSMVRWALDQGLSVFMISWVNPDASYRDTGFEDYLQKGLLTAIDRIKRISGSRTVNCAGYCLGGALVAAGAAYLARQGDTSIHSATYLATSFDFTDPGDIRVMIDDAVVQGVSEAIERDGYLDGRSLGLTFSMLRENELYWNYYVQNYLKGERPSGFDILYWNGDNTNVPARMHIFVMKELVRGNAFMRLRRFRASRRTPGPPRHPDARLYPGHRKRSYCQMAILLSRRGATRWPCPFRPRRLRPHRRRYQLTPQYEISLLHQHGHRRRSGQMAGRCLQARGVLVVGLVQLVERTFRAKAPLSGHRRQAGDRGCTGTLRQAPPG